MIVSGEHQRVSVTLILEMSHFIFLGSFPPIVKEEIIAVKVNRVLQWETWVQSLGWQDPWRRKWQPMPVFLPGEPPWTEEPDGLQSMRLQRVRYN